MEFQCQIKSTIYYEIYHNTLINNIQLLHFERIPTLVFYLFIITFIRFYLFYKNNKKFLLHFHNTVLEDYYQNVMYSLNMNQSKSTDYQRNLSNSNS